MYTDPSSGAATDDRASKILAALLSPWVLLVLSAFFLGVVYILYYKPRLYYSYSPYPPGKNIYLTIPFWRKRNFFKNPVQFFKDAQVSSPRRSIFWTDAIRVPGSKTISIICDPKMASQFLEIDDQDSLSWDAPLRLAWDDLFDSSSSFGASRQFYNASRYLLVNGFSEELTRSNSPYHLLVQNIANDWNTIAGHEELYGMIDRLVVKSLLSVVLGEQEEIEDITNMLDHLSADITASSSSSVHKSTKQTATLLRSVLVRIVNGRLSDVEQGIGHNDYLQFIVENKNMFNEDPDGLLNSRNASRHSDVTNTASIPSSDSPRHIADHLLVTLLQTRLLVTTCVTWKIVANTNHNAESDPAPLLLVRKTREETLFGSKIVPKDCLVGIAPVIQAASGPRTPKSRVNGWNDYRQNSTSDLDEISTTCSTADSPRSGHLGSVLRNFGSMDGKSPLLASTRYSSTVSMANLFQDTKMQLTQAGRTWDRRFPQNNLIQLLVNVIFQSMAGKFTIRSGALIKQHYGSARALWLPFPSEPILCDRAADVASASKHAQTIVSSL